MKVRLSETAVFILSFVNNLPTVASYTESHDMTKSGAEETDKLGG